MEVSKPRILVVDDDRLNRLMLSVNLEEFGCEVVTVENGAEALATLAAQPFDTMLLDLMMPVMDGFQVLEELRADGSPQRVPVIVISGEDNMKSVVRCIEMGAADHLPKPYNPVILRARVRACVEAKRAHDREKQLFGELELRYRELQQLHETVNEQAEKLKELSIRDALTGLHNRRYFDEQCQAAYARAERYGQPLTVMVGDIDFFKRINDNLSHAMGDETLRQVAQLLLANTREGDIVARYGGEEFVIAFTGTPLIQAISGCEKLRQALETHPWQSIHPDLRVTMSMGLCDDLAVGSFEKMLAVADKYLYGAKQAGRNRVHAAGYENHEG